MRKKNMDPPFVSSSRGVAVWPERPSSSDVPQIWHQDQDLQARGVQALRVRQEQREQVLLLLQGRAPPPSAPT